MTTLALTSTGRLLAGPVGYVPVLVAIVALIALELHAAIRSGAGPKQVAARRSRAGLLALRAVSIALVASAFVLVAMRLLTIGS
jgi:hypothetical protein